MKKKIPYIEKRIHPKAEPERIEVPTKSSVSNFNPIPLLIGFCLLMAVGALVLLVFSLFGGISDDIKNFIYSSNDTPLEAPVDVVDVGLLDQHGQPFEPESKEQAPNDSNLLTWVIIGGAIYLFINMAPRRRWLSF